MNFEEAAQKVRKLKKTPPDDAFLKCYGLYKQATTGDINIPKPGMTDVKAKAKYSAWEKNKGMSKDQATKEYIKFAEELIQKYGVNA
uniref:ACB domain-containing protein n=1 Tax=Syphacia muris TaxID=451379 RepID=A0A0N5AS99_9BILA